MDVEKILKEQFRLVESEYDQRVKGYEGSFVPQESLHYLQKVFGDNCIPIVTIFVMQNDDIWCDCETYKVSIGVEKDSTSKRVFGIFGNSSAMCKSIVNAYDEACMQFVFNFVNARTVVPKIVGCRRRY